MNKQESHHQRRRTIPVKNQRQRRATQARFSWDHVAQAKDVHEQATNGEPSI
jgi:hypothetical protein